MKSRICASLLIACLPWLAMAQSNDDLYFIPKKEKKTEQKAEVKSVPKQTSNNTTVYAAPGSTIVVKDVTGKTRDIDEYNRRYTSRDNTFSMQNDTLYIEEKPYGERGEWVNGFEGSQDDYEYAMRIIRFRSPRYAIPVSSPLYWDVVYGGYASWDWNIYEDGLYAYVFPTSTNPLWWDWRWNWALQARDGDSAGDGLLRGIIAVGILLTGMVATGVAIGEVTMAVTGVVTGDLPGIITIIIRTGQATTVSDIQTTARQDIQDILLPDAVRQDLVIPADLQLAHEEGLQVV